MELYYTIEQAANHLRVSQFTVRGWISQGRLRAERIDGYHLRIRSNEIHKIAEAISLDKSIFYGTANSGRN